MWKDKVLTRINQVDQEYDWCLLEKGQSDGKVLMVDVLTSKLMGPNLEFAGTAEDEVKAARWEHTHWVRAKSAMQNLFNQALPNASLSTLPETVSKIDPCDLWKLLEQTYGMGDAAGLIELKKEWNRLKAPNCSYLASLFASQKKQRNDINQITKALVNQEMVTESWLCMESVHNHLASFGPVRF